MVLAGIMLVCVAVTASGAAMLADLNAVLITSASGVLSRQSQSTPLLRASKLHAACRADPSSYMLAPLLVGSACALIYV